MSKYEEQVKKDKVIQESVENQVTKKELNFEKQLNCAVDKKWKLDEEKLVLKKSHEKPELKNKSLTSQLERKGRDISSLEDKLTEIVLGL